DPCPMFGQGEHISRRIRGDDGFATRRYAPADGCPDWYTLLLHGLESARSRPDAYEFSPCRHAETSLPLEDQRGGFSDGIEHGGQVQTACQSLCHCNQGRQPLLPLLGFLIEPGIADSHGCLGHEAIEEITVIRIEVERLLAAQRQDTNQRVF